ncbi:MAG: ferric reductase-like transmembrane domain-containing protein [Actinobacteria bacterium]|nr:ferric reductase-like transmembrane domain-containing protein [Actinomycetota bacterium]
MSRISERKFSAAGTDWAAVLSGLGLGLTVAIELTALRSSDISSLYSIIQTISRFVALIGTYFALLGILLVSRIPWVERGVGHDRLITWHRKLGPWSLYLIGFHVLLITIGYAGQFQEKIIGEFINILTTFNWMWAALAGFIFMITAGITSYKKARAKLSYEAWWTIHVSTYLAIALSFMHQILNGPMFISHPLNKAFWIFLYSAMVFCIVYWRIALPTYRSFRHGLKVEKIVVEGPNMVSVIMHGRDLDKLGAQGGQFFGWRFIAKGHALASHPYSLSASPTAHYLRITVKDLGDHSRSMADLKPGTRVFMEGPYGAFTAGRASRKHVVLVGGGVGITPIRALMEEFRAGVQLDVIFRASQADDLILREEMDYLASKSEGSIRVHYLVGSRKIHPMDAKSLKELVPRFADSDIYICGPAPLVEAVREAAKDLGVPKNRFHDEAFAFHSE